MHFLKYFFRLSKHQIVNVRLTTFWVVILSLTIFSNEGYSAYLKLSPTSSSRNPIVASITQASYKGLRYSIIQNPLFPNKIPGLKTTYEIQDDLKSVCIQQTLYGQDFKLPVRLAFQDYLDIRYQIGQEQSWINYLSNGPFEESQVSNRSGVGFEIPIPIKSAAFQKIFGGSSVGLQVTGNITINGGLRHEKRSQVKTALNRPSDFNFKMKQTQRFTVKGNIGEKVNVFVDQDSERPFEFNNAVRLQYKGFDDEIVESIEAGNVSLSLPGSRFVTFSTKSTGLFGIKSKFRFGNMKMTAIISQEKGQKKRLSITGGSTDEASKIDDYNYRKGTYFFLNRYFRDQFSNVNQDFIHLIEDPNRSIVEIEVYKSEFNGQAKIGEGVVQGWAIAFPEGANPANPDTFFVDQNHHKDFFKRLEQTEYFVQKELGYIALERPLSTGEVLAVSYRDISGNTVGDIDYLDTGGSSRIILQLLRTKNPIASDETWDLEWKNVYYLGTRNIDKEAFNLKIYFKPPSGDPQETLNEPGSDPVSYLEIFGLDRRDLNGSPNPDNLLDDDSNIINWARGEIIFPELEPFNSDNLPADKRVSAIYDTTDHRYITSRSNFYISTSAKIRQTSYSLGFNVIEDSEEIMLNGRRLQSGTDYNIDYFSGNLTLLAEEATDPNASLEISYESNQLFQIDRKTILGTRWDYELFNNSFIGGTLLYLNQSTLDQKVRIGQDGPMTNFVWNINTSLNFEPYFITKGLNALPFVKTKEPTTFKIEAELAEIIPNPNSRSNAGTGDNEGVVYVDDFESAKRETPLGVIRRQWTISSVPKFIPGWISYNLLTSDVLKNQSRGKLNWYNPFSLVPIREIWPEQDVNPNVPQTVNVLTLEFERKAQYFEQSWGGLMRYLSAGYADQSTSKFLEVWVHGDEGRLHFEFGQISEDAIPNGGLNTEDQLRNGIRNGILDEDEDTGLDGVAGRDGENVPGDAGDDDWSYTSKSTDYSRINGTEGNLNDDGGRFPDTEDLNRNGSLDLRNDYFSYSFSLDKLHPDTELIAGGLGLDPSVDRGWRMYRIPLADPDTVVGNPQYTNIEYVRLWVDEAPKDHILIEIAEINLVGSEWKERGVIPAGLDQTQIVADDDSTIQITVVNTYDNPDYEPPPGVAGVVDQITRVIQREQALVLKIENLEPGATGIVQKTFFKSQNYINYDKMKMFVYGRDPFGLNMSAENSNIELIFRFGANDKNYYELREKVFPGWDARNEIVLDFEVLTGLKNRPEYLEENYIAVVTEDGDTMKVVGKPSLTNVRELTVGVVNMDSSQSFTGEIWINELRLSGVKKDRGKALRARAVMKLADLGTINMEVNSIDDDFRTVNERFGKGNNKIGGNFNARLQIDKFLPKGLGISIPVNIGFQRSEASPKYFPGSDIIVSKKTASDSLLETIKTISKRTNFSVGLKRNRKSRNPLLKYTIDALSVNYSFSETFTSNSVIEAAKSKSYTGNISHNLNINSKFGFKPFGWLGNGPIVNVLSKTKLFLLPKRFNYKLSFNRKQNNSLNRNGLETPKYSFVINQNVGTSFQLLNRLSVDFSRTHGHDLRNILDWTEVLSGEFGRLTSISQSLKGQYNPSLSNWFKLNISANTNFRYNNNIQQISQGKSASNQVNYSASLSFTPKALVRKFSKKPTTRGRVRRTAPPKKEKEEEEDQEGEKKKDEDDEKGDKGGFSFPNPLKIFPLIGSNLQPISLRYSKKFSKSVYGLEEIPPFKFQIGRTFNPGLVESQNVGTNRGSFVKGYNLDASSGLDISAKLKVTLKYTYDNSQNQTTVITGSITDTRWRFGETEIPFPNWTIRWSGLEKIKFIKKYVKRLTLEHGRTGRLVTKWQDVSDNITNETFTNNFRPLVGATITWKGSLSSNISFDKSFSETVNKRSGSSATKKTRSDISASITYSKSGGLRIPLPFLKNKVIRNNIDFSMNFTKSLDISEQRRGEEGTYQEWTRNEKWSLTPRMTYSFSSTVRGGVHFEFGKTKNKVLGETKITEFGINVNIIISGR